MKPFARKILGPVILAWAMAAGQAALAQGMGFSKQFSPDTIPAGGISKLSFTVTNPFGAPVTEIGFSDTFPSGMTLAEGGGAHDCAAGTLSAPAGADTLVFSDGELGAFQSCTISAYVTVTTATGYDNISGTLTSSAGSAGPATDTLTATASDRPVFSKAFDPASISVGGIATLNFTIDNTANPSSAAVIAFTDNLPTGVTIASPANATTTCTGGTLTATIGSGTIAMAGALLDSGASCTVSVDVTSATVGSHVNRSGELTSYTGLQPRSSGIAIATLDVTGASPGAVQIAKDFTDDPVAPGGTATLEFALTNTDRANPATAVNFTDDLDAMLSGALYGGLISNSCGGTVSGSGVISFSGGSIAPGASCTIKTEVTVPGGASAGSYLNTTSQVQATIDASPVTGNAASNTLSVTGAIPLTFSKTFLTDPVAPGDTATMEFTIENTNSAGGTLGATSIGFTDELTTFLPFPVTFGAFPAAPCGAGSTVGAMSFGTDRMGFQLSGGNLAEGASCSFQISFTVPANMPGGTYTNTTSALSATIGDTGTVKSAPASGSFSVNSGAKLAFSKAFLTNPVVAGNNTTLQFTLSNGGESTAAVTGATFTDDLDAMLGGAVATGLPMANVCGEGTLTGTSVLTASGITLDIGETCTINVPVSVPAGAAAGTYTNTTSDLTATAAGQPVTFSPASAPLQVYAADAIPLTFSKEFTDDPVLPGGTATLRFTVTNPNMAYPATSIAFVDDLNSMLDGTTAPVLPMDGSCGAGSSMQQPGAGLLVFSNGSLPAGGSCSFDVGLLVPTAASGSYRNATSTNTAVVNGQTLISAPAIDTLDIIGEPIALTKQFQTNPVAAGGTSVLVFTLDNSSSQPATDIAFSDDLDAMLPGALYLNQASAGCGGTVSGVGTGTVGVSGIALAGGASCSFGVTVQIPADATGGAYVNTTSSVDSTLPGPLMFSSPPATDELSVTSAADVADIVVSKSANKPGASSGEPLAYSIAVTNDGPGLAPAVSLTDTLPAGLSCSYSSTASGGATGNSAAGNGDLAETLSMPSGSSVSYMLNCVIDPTFSGPLSNTATATSTVGDPNPANNSATAALTVLPPEPPLFAKIFNPDLIDQGQTTTLRFSIDNSGNFVDATALDFTDNFPAGLVVAATPATVNTCGGTVTAAPGTGTVSLSGGTVAAGAGCDVSLKVQALGAGSLSNVSGNLTSSSGDSGTANATLTVRAVPLGLSMAFLPASITQNGTSVIVYAFRNTAVIGATGMTLADTLPAGVTIASPALASSTCGGAVITAPAGGSTIGMTGGSLAAGASCTVRASVTSTTPGTYPNSTEAAASTLGVSAPASATLEVTQPVSGFLTIVVNTDSDGAFIFTSGSGPLNTALETSGGSGIVGPISLMAGSYAATIQAPVGVAVTDITCSDTDSSGDPTANSLAVNIDVLEAVTCTITAQASQQKTVDALNRFLTKRAALILSSEPNRQRRFDRLNGGFGGASMVSFAQGDLNALLPFSATIQPGSGTYMLSTSLLQTRRAAASFAMANTPGDQVDWVDNKRFDLWFEAQVKAFDAGQEGAGNFAIAYLGADYLVGPDLLVGALIQIDDMTDSSAFYNTSASGTGWMAGPYVTARLTPQLYLDARVAGGRSNNRVSPFNTYVDNFSTSRWLAQVNLTGEFRTGAWTIRPNASLAYFEELQAGYVDSVGANIPGQRVQMGEVKLGPTFTGHFEGEDGVRYEPYFSFDAIYNLATTSGATPTLTTIPVTNGWRGRVKAGLITTSEAGTRLSFGATYDGLGRPGFESWGLEFDLTLPLYKPRAQ